MNVTGRICLVLLLAGWTTTAGAEELQWRAAKPGEISGKAPAPVAGVRLGAPVPLMASDIVVPSEPAPPQLVGATSAVDAGLQPAGLVIRGQGPEGVPPVPPPFAPGMQPLGEKNYNCGEVLTPVGGQPQGGWWGNLVYGIQHPTGGRACLQSDHCFDAFISPVTNPFYFEDPRALTEVRPVFVYQQTPRENPVFAGSDLVHFSLQGRVALTDWLSFTIHKLGWTWMEVHNPTPDLQTHAGFSEVHLGPKFTFLRREQGTALFGQTLMAAGLVFELPVGGGDVAQDTGWLSLRPYLSFGQQFLESSYGRFQFLSTLGYSFAVDDERSDFFFLSAHLDYDVGRLGKIYPFVEMNWFHYAQDGDERDLNFEGTDLFNFGSRFVSGNDYLTIALGARYVFTPNIQLGGAIELPLLANDDMMDFRLVFDLIFRY